MRKNALQTLETTCETRFGNALSRIHANRQTLHQHYICYLKRPNRQYIEFSFANFHNYGEKKIAETLNAGTRKQEVGTKRIGRHDCD